MVQDMRKIRRKKERRYLAPLLFVLNLFLWGSAINLWIQSVDRPPKTTENFAIAAEIKTLEEQEAERIVIFENPTEPTYNDVNLHLYSSHALLINLDTSEILFDQRGRERTYPASVTKIMTVLVGLEHAHSNELVVYADFEALLLANAVVVGFANGEIRTLSEVLHGTMLSSGADATTTLAYHVAGSYQGFVDLMNETAERLGMNDTHFTNASGLHDDNHYTTAYDIAILLKYALENTYFREVITAEVYPFIGPDGHEQLMFSTMFLNMQSPIFNGGEILGGKTGYTTSAGLCLASIATNGTHDFALITFGAPPEGHIVGHIIDAFIVYEYFFNLEE